MSEGVCNELLDNNSSTGEETDEPSWLDNKLATACYRELASCQSQFPLLYLTIALMLTAIVYQTYTRQVAQARAASAASRGARKEGETEGSGERVTKLEVSLKAKDAEVKRLYQMLSRYKEKSSEALREATKDKTKHITHISKLRRQLTGYVKGNHELTRKLQEDERTLRSKQEGETTLQAQVSTWRENYRILQQQKKRLEHELQGANAKITKLQTEEESRSKSEAQLSKMKLEVSQKDTEVERIQRESTEKAERATEEHGHLYSKVQDLWRENEKLKVEMKGHRTNAELEIAERDKRLGDERLKLAIAQKRNGELESKLASLEDNRPMPILEQQMRSPVAPSYSTLPTPARRFRDMQAESDNDGPGHGPGFPRSRRGSQRTPHSPRSPRNRTPGHESPSHPRSRSGTRASSTGSVKQPRMQEELPKETLEEPTNAIAGATIPTPAAPREDDGEQPQMRFVIPSSAEVRTLSTSSSPRARRRSRQPGLPSPRRSSMADSSEPRSPRSPRRSAYDPTSPRRSQHLSVSAYSSSSRFGELDHDQGLAKAHWERKRARKNWPANPKVAREYPIGTPVEVFSVRLQQWVPARVRVIRGNEVQVMYENEHLVKDLMLPRDRKYIRKKS